MNRPSALRSPGSAAGRAVRVGVLGGASMLLATGAHRLGGGTLPGPGVLLVTGFLLGLAGLLLTTRRLRFPLLLGALGGQQLLLHELFDAATASAACTPAAVVHHAVHALSCGPGHGMSPMGSSELMLLGHVLATAATAWLLARGEATWWRLAERVVRAARCGATRSAARPSRPLAPAVRRVATAPLLDRAAPRGPPSVLA